MKSETICIGTGPILIQISFDSLAAEAFTVKLARKGLAKFLAFEVPLDL